MKRKISALFAALLIGAVTMTSCKDDINNVSETASSGGSGVGDNIALGASYYYDNGIVVRDDASLSKLTDGDITEAVTIGSRGDFDLNFSDWSGGSHTYTVDNGEAAFYVDFGFMTRVDSVSLHFTEYERKGAVGVFVSTDGYNFTDYRGEYDGYSDDGKTLTAALGGVYAKSVMFTIPLEKGETVSIAEVTATGEQSAQKKLLSLGASYEWEGAGRNNYPEDETTPKLTDGKTFGTDGSSALVGRSGGSITDPVTGRSGAVITMDLGEVKNVSEVVLSAYGGTALPDRICVRYSEDGETYNDFGQSFLLTTIGGMNTGNRYSVTRNHTVSARYVKIYLYTTELVVFDEIYVYGSEEAVSEPEYDFVTRANQLSNTNVAAYREAKLNGSAEDRLTDMGHIGTVGLADGANTVEVTVSAEDVCAVMLHTRSGKLSDISCAVDGKAVENAVVKALSVSDTTSYFVYFDEADAGTVTVSFSADGAELTEFAVYASQPHLPLVRGGFFQLSTNGSADASSKNSEYSWYLQLKGMKELGMEYVVIQYSTHFNAKTTLINGENITALGYRYTPTYGTEDLCMAVLDAAEKLGMKVWLGTIHDSDFTNPIGNMSQYEQIVNDSYAIIQDIHDMYGDHPAFGGYYLSDETCDQWLNLKGGVEACRYVYEGQSKYIRSIDSDATIMIAPAIWRSGEPSTGADNLYRMIAPASEGERPVVDIVAAQDCLGRESTLYVTPEAYASFESYVDEWAKAVRRAGADFWHDAEVFEITSTSKRYECVVESLYIEAKTSNTVIVFDIPHYFSTFAMGAVNNDYEFYKRLIMRRYAEYYAGWRELDSIDSGSIPAVITDDSKVVESPTEPTLKPIEYDEAFNQGVAVYGGSEVDDTIVWKSFKQGNASGNCPEFAIHWDEAAVYLFLKTNDETMSFGKGQWWEGKDDLVQVWLSGLGETGSDTLALNSGIRYYLHRTSQSAFAAGGESADDVTYGGFTFVVKDDVIIITMPWDSLGRSVPEAGDGTAFSVNVQYVDGADESWAASSGSLGRDLTEASLFSF